MDISKRTLMIIIITYITALLLIINMYPVAIIKGDSMEPTFDSKCHILIFDNTNNNINENKIIKTQLNDVKKGEYEIIKNYTSEDNKKYKIIKNNKQKYIIPMTQIYNNNNISLIENKIKINKKYQFYITEGEKKVVHRYVDSIKINDKDYIIMKGDNNNYIDPVLLDINNVQPLKYNINICD